EHAPSPPFPRRRSHGKSAQRCPADRGTIDLATDADTSPRSKNVLQSASGAAPPEPMGIRDPALTFAVALAAGMIAQITAVYLRMPGIVLLLILGVLLGPDVLGFVQPEAVGTAADHLAELAVVVDLLG